METIKIKYHDDELTRIEKIKKGDWIDLRSSVDIDMKKDEYAVIPLGISMIIPDGYEALVLPRSSTCKNFGIIMSNSAGVIDNSYSGTNDILGFPAIAVRDTSIKKNDRICQFRIIRNQPEIEFIECDKLNDADRGGFGSTGTR